MCTGGFSATATSFGAQGLWSLSGVPCDTCTVTVTGFCAVESACPPDPCSDSRTIIVNDANQGENQSLGFWEPPCLDDNDCDDGDACNGVETCNVATSTCVAGTPVVCDDGDACNGVETCDVATGDCVDGTPVVCDDGEFCNGVETCETDTDTAGAICVDGDDPCPGDCCDEISDTCGGTMCESDGDCPDDGLACTTATCNVQTGCCEQLIESGNCLIDAVCYADGAVNPGNSCQSCQPLADTTGWSPLPDGTSCDDLNGCTSGDACASGSCTGIPIPCCPCCPDCTGRACGDDGCGGSCGTCTLPETCNTDSGTCEPCPPDCAERECGPDGCLGGSCGTCAGPETCDTDSGTCVCVPDCAGRECGDDGCGESCGTCTLTETCNTDSGTCEPCPPDCAGRECGSDGCPGGSCGTCPDGQVCEPDTGACFPCITDSDCDDGDVCNGPENCDPIAGCQAGTPLECNDVEPCTDDLCDPGSGCDFPPNTRECDDGDPCSLSDICTNGTCGGGPRLNCREGEACLAEFCRRQCASDEDCRAPMTCNIDGLCAREGDEPNCTTADDCNADENEVCNGGYCIVECGPERECPTATACLRGGCVPEHTIIVTLLDPDGLEVGTPFRLQAPETGTIFLYYRDTNDECTAVCPSTDSSCLCLSGEFCTPCSFARWAGIGIDGDNETDNPLVIQVASSLGVSGTFQAIPCASSEDCEQCETCMSGECVFTPGCGCCGNGTAPAMIFMMLGWLGLRQCSRRR